MPTGDDEMRSEEPVQWVRFFRAALWLLVNAVLVSAAMSQGPRSPAGGLIDHRLTPNILQGALAGLALFGPLAVAIAMFVRSRLSLTVALIVLTTVQYLLWASHNNNPASDGAMVLFLGWLLTLPIAAFGMAIQIVRAIRSSARRLSSEP